MEATTRSNPSFPLDGANSASTVNRAAAGMNGAVDRMADSATQQVKPAIERAAQIAHQAVNKAADVAGPTAHWISEQGESLLAARLRAVEAGAATVRANPWKTVGIAVVAGFFLSRYLR
jgi:ElaB/YqjD/DUF883 family membrane-anchored ribosome-binding protein